MSENQGTWIFDAAHSTTEVPSDTWYLRFVEVSPTLQQTSLPTPPT